MIANRRVGSMPVVAVCACAAALLTPTVAQAQVFTMTREQLIEYTAQNPFERFPDGRPKVPDALMQRPGGMSVEEVRLMGQHNGHQPIGVLERPQPAGDVQGLQLADVHCAGPSTSLPPPTFPQGVA